jgi:hypothetical protein
MHDGPNSNDAPAHPWRVLIFNSAGFIMLVAWMIFSAWTHPQSRTTFVLQALLLVLLVAFNWVSKSRRDALVARLSKPRTRRTSAALPPLVVLTIIGVSLAMEADRRGAERKSAEKREAWKQAVERQRKIADLAANRSHEAFDKYTEAFRSLGKSWEQVQTADGQTVSRPHRDAFKKLNEAHDAARRAIDLRRAEDERLHTLERERPGP